MLFRTYLKWYLASRIQYSRRLIRYSEREQLLKYPFMDSPRSLAAVWETEKEREEERIKALEDLIDRYRYHRDSAQFFVESYFLVQLSSA
jgi:hypothetical protein